jgi:hypothetical protein
MKEKNIERRYMPVTELRAIEGENGLRKITGYAAVFNKLSDDLGYFREKIQPGAFKNTIKADDIRALWNHDSNYILGRNRSGTLSLSEDDHGLKIEIDPPDAQWARDLMTSIERGDVDQMSFGFRTITDSWQLVDGEDIRTLIEVKLFDVSPVTFPAYPDTEVGLRSLEEHKKAAGPSTDEGRTEDPSITLGLLQEEDQLLKQITGLQEEEHE